MYTSGSTGQPKGVMLTHKMVTAAVSGTFDHLLGDIVKGDDLYISYLPAAHILEFTAQMTFFCYGAQIGYACPKTISSKVRPVIESQPGLQQCTFGCTCANKDIRCQNFLKRTVNAFCMLRFTWHDRYALTGSGPEESFSLSVSLHILNFVSVLG